MLVRSELISLDVPSSRMTMFFGMGPLSNKPAAQSASPCHRGAKLAVTVGHSRKSAVTRSQPRRHQEASLGRKLFICQRQKTNGTLQREFVHFQTLGQIGLLCSARLGLA